MARYRLTDGHYLNVKGTEWEQTEVDLTSGRQIRQRYPVPMYLNPKFQEDHNYPGEIIIADKPDPRYPRDIIFVGPPTKDMTPLDEEAEAAIASLPGGQHPINDLPGNGVSYSDSLLQAFQNQLDQLARTGVSPAPAAPDRVNELEKQIAELRALLTEAKPKITIGAK